MFTMSLVHKACLSSYLLVQQIINGKTSTSKYHPADYILDPCRVTVSEC